MSQFNVIKLSNLLRGKDRDNQFSHSLPARASEQGNVIGSVSVYIYIYIYVIKKNCN